MSVFAIASAKSSPGATTLAAALCHAWPESRTVLLAEIDPWGGDLGARWGLAAPGAIPRPGLFTLAVDAGLSRPTVSDLRAHSVDRDGVLVLAAPPHADQCKRALRSAVPWMLDALSDWPGDVVVDCGQLSAASPVLDVATNADALIVLSRPTPEELPRAAALLREAEGRGARALLVLRGEGVPVWGRRYTAREAAALGVEVFGVVADDRKGAKRLASPAPIRDIRRASLLRSAHALAVALVDQLGADAAVADEEGAATA